MVPSGALDFLAVISRPTFPTGSGVAGDSYNIGALIKCRSDWNAAVLELNHTATAVRWDGKRLFVTPEGRPEIALDDVGVVLFLPICLEPEETLLRPIDRNGEFPQFEAEQWRAITTLFEEHLNQLRPGACLNQPQHVRRTNNKMLQFELLTAAGFSVPLLNIDTSFPLTGELADSPRLVSKNISEGGWKSPTDFSPARLVGPDDPVEPWPALWQQPIVSERELRIYVMGDEVTFVELPRDPDVLDVRATNNGKPKAQIVHAPEAWQAMALGMTRALGLDYGVIDAIPVGDELHVLEVNANGVWWFLPDVAQELEARFHRWLEQAVDNVRD
jgi:hypothetical protein